MYWKRRNWIAVPLLLASALLFCAGLPLRLLPDCCKWGICGWIPRPIQSTPGIPGWS